MEDGRLKKKRENLQRKSRRKHFNQIHHSGWGGGELRCFAAVNQHTRAQAPGLVRARTEWFRANTLQARSWCEFFRFGRLAVSDLMTLHILSSSSHNKNSLFCSCLDAGGGRRGRNTDPIQRTDQHDRSLERALSPPSEWQLVKPRWLAQPLLSSLCLSFCLNYYPDRPSSPTLFQSPLPSILGSPALLLPITLSSCLPSSLCPSSHFVVLLSLLPSTSQHLSPSLLFSFLLSSNTQKCHVNLKRRLYWNTEVRQQLTPPQTHTHKLISVIWICSTQRFKFCQDLISICVYLKNKGKKMSRRQTKALARARLNKKTVYYIV